MRQTNKLAELHKELSAIKVQIMRIRKLEKATQREAKRREKTRRLAAGLREGDSQAGKQMLAKRAGKASARQQRASDWPNLRKAWNARRSGASQ